MASETTMHRDRGIETTGPHAEPQLVLCTGTRRDGRPCKRQLFRALSAHLQIACPRCGHTQWVNIAGASA